MYLSKIFSLVGTKDATDRNVLADGSGVQINTETSNPKRLCLRIDFHIK